MTTKKILIKGLGADISEADIRTRLDCFGQVVRINIIREGSTTEPHALVEMEIGDKAAAYLAFHMSRIWSENAVVSARLLNH
jgi:hypothetical protein